MFDKTSFMTQLAAKLPNATICESSRIAPIVNQRYPDKPAVQLGHGALFRKGAAHAERFIAPQHSDDEYISGYRYSEHPIVTLTITGEAPKYSYCDTNYGAIGEWHLSKQAALKAAWLSRSPMLLLINKSQSFNEFVTNDLLVKPDVQRTYQQSIDGLVMCSVNGKQWWEGGIMNCPAIPIVRVFNERASVKGNEYRSGYVKVKATEDMLVKGSLTKLKPERPKEPRFFYGPAWWDRHLKNNTQCYWDCKCEHYYAAEKKYHSDTEKYQLALKKWLEL